MKDREKEEILHVLDLLVESGCFMAYDARTLTATCQVAVEDERLCSILRELLLICLMSEKTQRFVLASLDTRQPEIPEMNATLLRQFIAGTLPKP